MASGHTSKGFFELFTKSTLGMVVPFNEDIGGDSTCTPNNVSNPSKVSYPVSYKPTCGVSLGPLYGPREVVSPLL